MTDANLDRARDEPERSRFGGFHVRTFEAELLISGAVVFGLFQVPPVLTTFFDMALVRLDGQLRLLALYALTYPLMVVYGLIGAFLVHLALRAYWIGLVGLESVFPHGIRWDRVKAGPFFIRYLRRRLGRLAETIEKVDDLCSLVFSFGFMIVIVFAYSIILLIISATASFVLSRLFFGGEFTTEIFWVVFGGTLAVQIIVSTIDRLLGSRIPPDGLFGRFFDRLIRVSFAISPVRWIGLTQLTLQSNTTEVKVTAAMMAAMFCLGLGMMGIMFGQAGLLHFDSLQYFPESLREQGLDSRHYRDARVPDSIEPAYPTIQGDVVTEPYLELFIPYFPKRHNRRISETCPDLEAFKTAGFNFGRGTPPEGETVQRAAECLGALFGVELDGEPIEDLVFDFTRDPASRLEGILAHIPVADLAFGRHELVLLVPPRDEFDDTGEPADPIRHLIPFWR